MFATTTRSSSVNYDRLPPETLIRLIKQDGRHAIAARAALRKRGYVWHASALGH